MKFTKLISVTLKVGQGDPHTIPKQVSHGRYLHTKFGDLSSSLSRLIVVTSLIWWTSQFDLCELESGSKWPTYNHKQVFNEKYLHTKFGVASSFSSQVIAATSLIGWNSKSWPMWPWKWVTVAHIQSQAGFLWELSTHYMYAKLCWELDCKVWLESLKTAKFDWNPWRLWEVIANVNMANVNIFGLGLIDRNHP